MMKNLFLSLLMLLSVEAFACSCAHFPLLEYYQQSEFIASAEIISVVKDSLDKDYHDIQIRLINVYKGAPLNKLKVTSSLHTSCGFLPEENSTWLIFASKDRKGFLTFGFCSGSKQIDRKFDLLEYPNLDKKYKKSIDLKLQALGFLKKNNIAEVNRFDLTINTTSTFLDSLRGFREDRRFAVYEVNVNRDLSIESILPLRNFSNKELSGKLLKRIKDLQFDMRHIKMIPEETKVIMVFFYYPEEKDHPSFISK